MSGLEFDEFGNPVGENAVHEHSNEFDEIAPVDQDGTAALELVPDSETALVERNTRDEFQADVDVLVETVDTEPVDKPLVNVENIQNTDHALFARQPKHIPKSSYNRAYLLDLLAIPERIRNVALIGGLKSGKTSLADIFVLESHKKIPNISRNIALGWKQLRYTDNMRQEVERGISIKLNGLTILSTDLQDKSYALNIIDAPGHVNFMDETAVALAVSDCAIICIDVVEGVTSVVERLIKHCQNVSQPILFVFNKIDRLILELKLPPADCYLKLKCIVDDINVLTKGIQEFSPELGNIIFASAKFGFTFSIKEFVKYFYSSKIPNSQAAAFVGKLWGDYYFHQGEFLHKPTLEGEEVTFVSFILHPLYKIFTHTLSSESEALARFLKRNFAFTLDTSYYSYDPFPLLKYVLNSLFRKQSGLVDSIVQLYDVSVTTSNKLQQSAREGKTNDNDSLIAHALKTLDYGGKEWTLVRIYRGRIFQSMKVRIVDNNEYDSLSSEVEEASEVVIKNIALLGGRYVVPITEATANQVVLVEGISEHFVKSASLFASDTIFENVVLFKPLDYINQSAMKVVLAPLAAKDSPKLLAGLNKVIKYYPALVSKVEESGEHYILGTGELFLDCLLYDLRKVYSKIEVKLSAPLTIFSESCSAESFAAIPAKSSNGDISITVGAEPLTPQIIRDYHDKGQLLFEDEVVGTKTKERAKILRKEYGWDSLMARNLWSFHHVNALINDILPDEADKDVIEQYRQQLCQGFYWAIREGPLAEEPLYGVNFKLLGIELPDNFKLGSQIIPVMRKACYIALMTATPILLEPIYEVQILVRTALTPIVEQLLKKKRGGRVYRTDNIPATPFVQMKCQIPVIESIGFETDLRLATEGNAMCQLSFCRQIWRRVPGDVLDKDAPIPKLAPAPAESLSRDFVMKTRRRKGISHQGFMSNDGPSLEKYIDADLYKQLAAHGLVPS